MTRRLATLLLPLLASACGGGGSSPTPPPTPAGPTGSVQATLFYDENLNGQLDANEVTRIPNANVVIGPVSAKTQPGSGIALVQQIPYGTQTVTVQTDSLPPYWQVSSPAVLSIPEQGEARIAASLPIGRDIVPNQYLAFGDSLTQGVGSSTGQGYPPMLEAALRSSMGAAWVGNRGVEGTTSIDGAKRIQRAVDYYKPTHTIILYGTNDWNSPQCQMAPAAACYTIDELAKMIDTVKGRKSLPVLSLLLPVSVNTGRNVWIEEMNGLIKALGRDTSVAVVDAYTPFKSAANMKSLYFDDVHLNDAGYQLLAQTYAKALTSGRSTATAQDQNGSFVLGFDSGGAAGEN